MGKQWLLSSWALHCSEKLGEKAMKYSLMWFPGRTEVTAILKLS